MGIVYIQVHYLHELIPHSETSLVSSVPLVTERIHCAFSCIPVHHRKSAVTNISPLLFPSRAVVNQPWPWPNHIVRVHSLTTVAFPSLQHRQDQPSHYRQSCRCSVSSARVQRPGLRGGHFSLEVTGVLQGLDQRGMRTGTLVQHKIGQYIDVTLVQMFCTWYALGVFVDGTTLGIKKMRSWIGIRCVL